MNDICAWLTTRGSSCLELFGFVTGVLNVWLVTREHIWAWPVGILNAAAYLVFFAQSGLYSDTGLQAGYAVLSAYGWWHWTRHDLHNESKTPLAIGHVSARTVQQLALFGVGMWVVLAIITSRIPGTALPWLDSALVASSLVAQWMMTRKLLEHWIVWIAVDVVYVGVFVSRGYMLTAVLYLVFLFLAVFGFVQWTRSSRRHNAAA
jgi:nicotinamide mononucleotide transporter